jgi:hypothetical protein
VKISSIIHALPQATLDRTQIDPSVINDICVGELPRAQMSSKLVVILQ